MTRRVLLCAALALLFALPADAAAPVSWALPQIKAVTAKGLMGGTANGFRPEDPLTQGELAALVQGLGGKPGPAPVDPAAPATLGQLDAQLVRGLGLLPVARQFTAAVRAAGLVPRSGFGTEVVARLLGLRVNHPAAQDSLELGPTDPVTRAEAAYSAARVLAFAGGEADYVKNLAATFQLPPLAGLQRDVLQTAISLVGYPYVWAGTSERPQDPLATGNEVPGGFDCSGFVWRVFKLESYPGAEALGATIKGRSTYAMSAEVKPPQRIPLTQLEPGDLLFFGAHGRRSKPAEIDHAGIYLGNGWFVQSSEQGVALATLSSPWYAPRFAWARRPIAEAALT
ncbi:MAG TPA: NlpC/P60 family protein [Gaiellaceae bacterium]|nr:NlpC/P60 family protein [Gaiellaceae bacterium]